MKKNLIFKFINIFYLKAYLKNMNIGILKLIKIKNKVYAKKFVPYNQNNSYT